MPYGNTVRLDRPVPTIPAEAGDRSQSPVSQGFLARQKYLRVEHIDVETLSALTADIGTITSGILQSADGLLSLNLDTKLFKITDEDAQDRVLIGDFGGGATDYGIKILDDDGDLIFNVDDSPGVATCLDARSGTQVWQQRVAGKYSASPIYADNKIYFCSLEGKTTVIAPGREYTEVATNQLDDGFMASPAVVDSSLILRTRTHLYRID